MIITTGGKLQIKILTLHAPSALAPPKPSSTDSGSARKLGKSGNGARSCCMRSNAVRTILLSISTWTGTIASSLSGFRGDLVNSPPFGLFCVVLHCGKFGLAGMTSASTTSCSPRSSSLGTFGKASRNTPESIGSRSADSPMASG